MNETLTYTNPFNNGIEIKKVVVESTRSETQMRELLTNNEVSIENEWYVLFENGTLIEKSRSKVRSSDYLKGIKHKAIKEHYEVL